MNYSIIFENFSNWIEINYYFSIFLFFIFILFYSLVSLPGLILFWVFAGFVFGIFLSYVICIISVTIGCFCFFILSKLFFNKFFRKKNIKYLNQIDNFIENSSLEYLIIFRLIPGPPLMMQNLILSFLDISNYKFIFSTFIGITPIMIFSILVGNKLNNLNSVNKISINDIITWDLLLIIFFFIFIIFTRIFFKKKKTK